MTTTARRPGRTSATRARLFVASMELFGERGPDAVTVDEIAARAGLAKGTVYYNFSSKSGLVAELLAFGVEMMVQRLSDVSAQDPEADSLERAAQMLGRALDFLDEYPSFARLWMSEIWRTPNQSEWSATLIDLRDRLFELVRMALRDIAAEHTVRGDIEAEQLAVAITGSVTFFGLNRTIIPELADRDSAIRTLMAPVHGWLAD